MWHLRVLFSAVASQFVSQGCFLSDHRTFTSYWAQSHRTMALKYSLSFNPSNNRSRLGTARIGHLSARF